MYIHFLFQKCKVGFLKKKKYDHTVTQTIFQGCTSQNFKIVSNRYFTALWVSTNQQKLLALEKAKFIVL